MKISKVMNMKSIRIGCGAGCSYDRIEPAEELIKYGNLDYIVFECLAERTMADNMKAKTRNSKLGYTPMLKERMERMLKLSIDNNVKIITNMGGGNIDEALKVIIDVVRKDNIKGLKVGVVKGDDILKKSEDYAEYELSEEDKCLKDIEENIISMNVYLGSEGVVEALEKGANFVLTGRIADASLFIGPIKYEFEWDTNNKNELGQAALLGHLLECAGQLTGGYAADPGYKDIENLHKLGFPIGEINEKGEFFVEKVKGSGGEVSERICKEQLIYEIKDPSNYITPDAIVDFSEVTFKEIEKDKVEVKNSKMTSYPESLKVCVGYNYGFLGEAEVSFGGENAVEKAKLCEDIIRKRLEIINVKYEDISFHYIGYNSLYKNSIMEEIKAYKPFEIRLRLSVRGKNHSDVLKIIREVDFLYTNGPGGSSGISSNLKELIGITSFLIPREDVDVTVKVVEV